MPYREKDPVAIKAVVCFDLVIKYLNCVLLSFSQGAFQCPSVLCGSLACLGGIGMSAPVSESLIRSGISGAERSGVGVPLGANLNLRT